ncbi:DUF6361 family protein [Luteipulveratus halotolerans]|uniref:Uncharacterized protein n=1 Tax=Luteipulveratus halotolerans TaxID=1631356 RepID=A0A0L6CMS9_9MICO|nr:DUF6361 family protein [Luteipulveratus halotolerans]KNX38858.1 hypothetical protein VV01_19730 [Luteipulveratus halotolerans]
MTSSIAWLDTSAEQRRQANEIIALFTQQESRDELGIGTVRDAFSNLLFPGTSVLLTRARYCLFVPWAFQVRQVASLHGPDHVKAGERAERRLVETLIEEEPHSGAGVIGRRVGREVRNLPSTIYWGTLTRWGITPRTSMSLLGQPRGPRDVATELDHRADTDWHPDLPTAPDDFPASTDGGFALRPDEAAWLRDRILDTCPDTALAELVTPEVDNATRLAEVEASRGPWDLPALARREDVGQADLFSLTLEGANLVYNLLVAERCDAAGLVRFDGYVDRYREHLDSWANDMTRHSRFATWDLDDLWAAVLQAGSPPQPTRTFVEAWISQIRERGVDGVADDNHLRNLVAQRERRKGKQSRLVNDKMLETWSGESAVGRLNYRWGTLRVLARDILTGLEA